LRVYRAFNDQDEAQYVINRIQQWVEEGGQRHEIAVLYRSNAQSRGFEELLVRAAIPYRVYGGLKYFERAEVKDALAYLRLASNAQDDAAFERIINTPPRSIGAKTVETIRASARKQNITLWQSASQLVRERKLPARAENAVQNFIELIESLEILQTQMPPPDFVEHLLSVSGLKEFHGRDETERAMSRVENMEELVNAIRQFEQGDDPLNVLDEKPPGREVIQEFLAHAALEAGDNQTSESESCVQLMTLHSAKGLEFKLVFLTGMEQGLFPHRNALESVLTTRLEEERRLCYVGITRAMQQLEITWAERRTLYGQEQLTRPSMFMDEIPADLVFDVRPVKRTVSHNTAYRESSLALNPSMGEEALESIRIGQNVIHKKFGDGVVTDLEGQGARARVQVNFSGYGSRWLMLNVANLQTQL